MGGGQRQAPQEDAASDDPVPEGGGRIFLELIGI